MARDFGFEPVDKPPYYFISYNSQDSSRVASICREMNRRGVPMWYDKGLLSGEKWEKQIISKIKSCREVIMFVTKRLMARENPFVRKEFFFAQQYHKKLHVVMLDEINFNDVSEDLKGWFFDIEALHGVYPPAGADAKTVVNTMDGLIHLYTVPIVPNLPVRQLQSEQKAVKVSTRQPVFQENNKVKPSKSKMIILAPAIFVALLVCAGGIVFYILARGNAGNVSDTNFESNYQTIEPRDVTFSIDVDEVDVDFVQQAAVDFSEQYIKTNPDVKSLTIDVQAHNFYDLYSDIETMPDIINSECSVFPLPSGNNYVLPDNVADRMKSEVGNAAESVKIDNRYYGFPYKSYSAHILIYDSSLYSKSEADDLNVILDKGQLGIIGSPWYEITWLFSAGGKFFPNNAASICSFDSDECMEMIKFVHKNQSKIVRTLDEDELIDLFLNKQINAMFFPSWATAIKKFKDKVSDGYRVAVLPNVTVNSHTYRMRCWDAPRVFAINSTSKEPDAATEFVLYLLSAEVQLNWYFYSNSKSYDFIPINRKLLYKSDIQSDEFTYASMQQSENVEFYYNMTGVSGWWNDSNTVINSIYDGTLTQADMTTYVEKWKAGAEGG